MTTPDKAAMRKMIAQYGGAFHGPHVEHLSMEEQAFWRFMDAILADLAPQPGQAVDLESLKQAGVEHWGSFTYPARPTVPGLIDHLSATGMLTGAQWMPARWDELGSVMKFTKQDREACNRFIGCLRACGFEIMKPATPSQKETSHAG